MIENYESKLFDQNQKLNDTKSENLQIEKQVLKLNDQIAQQEEEKIEINNTLEKYRTELELARSENSYLVAMLSEKKQKVDQYSTEIYAINRKIADFNVLVESLI